MSLLSLWQKNDSSAKYTVVTSGYSSAGADPYLLPNLMKLLTSGTTGIHNILLHKSAVLPALLQILHS